MIIVKWKSNQQEEAHCSNIPTEQHSGQATSSGTHIEPCIFRQRGAGVKMAKAGFPSGVPCPKHHKGVRN